MILNLQESLDLGDWLLIRGLGLGEVSELLSDLECGDSFPLALRKIFYKRQIISKEINEKKSIHDWGNPITP